MKAHNLTKRLTTGVKRHNICTSMASRWIIFLTACFIVGPSLALADSHADKTTVKIGVFQIHPMVFFDENTPADGLFIDVVKEIARQEHWHLEYVQGTWAQCLQRVTDGEIDLLGCVMHLQERESFLDFPKHEVITTWGQVYTHEDSSIYDIFGLDGKTVGVLKNGANGGNFKKLAKDFNIKCNFRDYDTFELIADDVEAGKADAGVFVNVHGYAYEKSHAVKQTSIIFSPTHLKYATTKGSNRNIIEAIDKYLLKWKKDKQSPYYKILNNWFSLPSEEVMPQWLLKSIYASTALLIAIVMWVFILRRQVQVRTREIEAASQQLRANEHERQKILKTLEAKNKELQSIVYVASHDLKSPIVNINGFGNLLWQSCEQALNIIQNKDIPADEKIEKIEPLFTDDIYESLEFISAGTKKSQSLLDALLKVSRVGNIEIDIQPLDMNALISDIKNTVEYQLNEKNIEMTIEQLPNCLGDSDQINQVFSNLIDNAIKYRHPDRKGTIIISAETNIGYATYCVADNGIGIETNHQEKVFELFHRLNPDSSENGEGIGLTIISRILGRHDGHINVDSQPGEKTRFYVTLPIA